MVGGDGQARRLKVGKHKKTPKGKTEVKGRVKQNPKEKRKKKNLLQLTTNMV